VALDLYRKEGMGPEESIRFIREAANEGVESLGLVAEQLKALGDAARESGMSAADARANFSATFAQVSDIAPGDQAAGISGAIALGQTRMGHGYQDVGTSGLGGGMAFYEQASLLGYETPGDYYAAIAGPETVNAEGVPTAGGGVAVLGRQLQVQRAVEQFLPPEALEQMRDAIAAQGNEVTPEFLEEQAAILAGEYGVDPVAMSSYLNAYLGVSTTPENAITWALGYESGLNNPTEEYTTRQGEFAQGDALFDDDLAAEYDFNSIANDEEEAAAIAELQGVAEELGFSDPAQDLQEAIDSPGLSHGSLAALEEGGSGGFSGQAGDEYSYLGELLRGGRRNPVVEALLTDEYYDPDRRFTVEADGEMVDVTLGEAITHYQDQLQQGGVTIAEGEGEGGTVAELLQIPESDIDTPSTETDAGVGEESEGETGRVVIVPSPWLEGALEFMGYGGAEVTGARNAGVPPDPHAPWAPGSGDN
jgi:hypothetical protein